MKSTAFGFVPWLGFFLISLLSIPLFIWLDYLLLAKIIGFIVTVSIVVALRIWLGKLAKAGRPERISLNANDQFDLNQWIITLNQWPESDRQALIHRVGLILPNLTIENKGDSPEGFTPKQCAMIVACFLLKEGLHTNAPCHVFLRNEGEIKNTDDGYEISFAHALISLKQWKSEDFSSKLS